MPEHGAGSTRCDSSHGCHALEFARMDDQGSSDWGAKVLPDGRVRFRLWAPAVSEVRLSLVDRPESLPLNRLPEGWHELVTDLASAGSLYRFALDRGLQVPDPASRFQPQDVSGPSEVIDTSQYVWLNLDWKGRPWHEAVIYELHVGSFTPEGTFRAAMEKLPHLAELGVTAIELMPIGDFPGTRNWGYDGVFWYAPESTYGRPEHLQEFVDAAHGHGLMVFLDVVYNHFGPEGNYLGTYAPSFFTERHHTPWGAAINYDGRHSSAVRDFAIENAQYWLAEFRLDGLRLDAVHTILDDSPRHLLDELADRVRRAFPDRHVHLILENEENQARRIARDSDSTPTHYTAQWNDDVHHVLHTAATGEGSGYYADYLGDDGKLARALAEGFAFQGERMTFRGTERGEPSAHLPPEAFVAFIQNHDQVGNRAFGDRLNEIAPEPAVRAVAACYLLLPQVPMLFMGEEWSAEQPFPFFCDFHGALADAVREGRRAEFARFPEFQDPVQRSRIPDPQSPETFRSAKLNWGALDKPQHRAWLEWYSELLGVRRREIVSRIPRIGGHGARYEVPGPGAVRIAWNVKGEHGNAEQLRLLANLCHRPLEGAGLVDGRIIWLEGEPSVADAVPPWTVCWSIRELHDPELSRS
jgi:malto-oligosyltrehalose trehalohydrolase